jgi:excinuclease UvrABC nuclease subunit
MILSTYEEGNKSAIVCLQGKEFVVQYYQDNNYLRAIILNREQDAEVEAEKWVLGE